MKPALDDDNPYTGNVDILESVAAMLGRLDDSVSIQVDGINARLDILFDHLGIPTQEYVVDYEGQPKTSKSSIPVLRIKK